jgi:hypothetical protein
MAIDMMEIGKALIMIRSYKQFWAETARDDNYTL